jgi:hypothetical protein
MTGYFLSGSINLAAPFSIITRDASGVVSVLSRSLDTAAGQSLIVFKEVTDIKSDPSEYLVFKAISNADGLTFCDSSGLFLEVQSGVATLSNTASIVDIRALQPQTQNEPLADSFYIVEYGGRAVNFNTAAGSERSVVSFLPAEWYANVKTGQQLVNDIRVGLCSASCYGVGTTQGVCPNCINSIFTGTTDYKTVTHLPSIGQPVVQHAVGQPVVQHAVGQQTAIPHPIPIATQPVEQHPIIHQDYKTIPPSPQIPSQNKVRPISIATADTSGASEISVSSILLLVFSILILAGLIWIIYLLISNSRPQYYEFHKN